MLAAGRSRRAATWPCRWGRALSELAMMGYEAELSEVSGSAGFPILPRVAGHVITVEKVDDALDEQ